MDHPTAAILLIGNELLSGKVADENTHFLTKALYAMGIEVRRVLLVPDEIDEVVEALNDLLSRADYIITSGGIGPTHDDITVEAVAKALGQELILDEDLKVRARSLFGEKLNSAHLKMATVPEGATLVESERTRWPALVVDRVFVLAGVPKILRRGFDAVKELLPHYDSPELATLYVTTDEWTLAPVLDEVVATFADVQLGSYPVLDDPTYRVRLTLEGADISRVEQALYHLIERLPPGDIVRTERP